VKTLWTVYQFACRSCGRFLYECRVPGDRKAEEYKPVECGHCSSTLISERIKGAA
jgi:DNA-directed RNA polymerase subunit RPC12/RpoP